MKEAILLSFSRVLAERLAAQTGLIQVLLGPRQVGKTTTILKLIEDQFKDQARYVSAEDTFNPDALWLKEHWAAAYADGKILFIDEIQKLQNWSAAIKAIYDESKRSKKLPQCVLMGSSSLEIQKGLTESLTGRFQLIRAHHWNYAESNEGYGVSLDDYFKYGGYPGAYQFRQSNDWFDYVKTSIISTVIEKDILLYQRVKSPALFRQAFEILMSYPAQEISYTKLLGQLQDRGNVDLVKYYISLYEGAYLIKALEKFSMKSTLTKGSSPKILPLAPCLPYLQIRAEYSPDEKGRIFEAIVGAQLHRTGENVFYWRKGQYEVDFVVKIGKAIYAIEVKSARIRKTSGINAFKKEYPTAKTVFVHLKDYLIFESDPIGFIKERAL